VAVSHAEQTNAPVLVQSLVQNEVGDMRDFGPQPEGGCQGEDAPPFWVMHAESIATTIERVNVLHVERRMFGGHEILYI